MRRLVDHHPVLAGQAGVVSLATARGLIGTGTAWDASEHMSKPFPKEFGHPQVEVGNGVDLRSLLALMGMKIFSMWSDAEAAMARVFISLLGAKPGTAVTVLVSLKNNHIQREDMLAGAREHIEEEGRDLFIDVLDC